MAVTPMYSEDQVTRLAFLTNNGYNFSTPNSVQSQRALELWDQQQTQASGQGGQKNTMASPEPVSTTVANTSQSGIQEQVVRDDLINKALATPADNTKRDAALDTLNSLLKSFSPEASNADTNALMSQSMQKAAEAFMPGMTRGMQAAGQSGSSMQALMSQRAASDAAYNAANLAAQNKSQYGNISANLAGVLNDLTKADYGQQQLALDAADMLKTSSSVPSTVTSGGGFGPMIGVSGSSGGNSTGFSGGSMVPVTAFPGAKPAQASPTKKPTTSNPYTLIR